MTNVFPVLSCVLLLPALTPSPQAQDLSTQLMQVTFKLAHEKSTATGFVLSRLHTGSSRRVQYLLVTAAHVVESMTGDEATLFCRRQESEGVYKKVPMKVPIRKAGKPLWVKHPAADVAVLDLVPPREVPLPALPVDLLATDDTLKHYALHPGDNLLCLGYPHRVEANEAGFPVLRSGPVATYPLLPTRATKTFLLSMNTFEGDSGGPVYLADPHRLVAGKQPPLDTRLILGLVTGQHFLDEEARLIYGSTRLRQRLGLAIVVHATFIREAIERLPHAP